MRHEPYIRDNLGEYGVIGWISFSEVFLLGVVVLLATALFLEARVIRGENKTRQLRGKLETMTGRGRGLTERIHMLEEELKLAQAEEGRRKAEAVEQLRLAQAEERRRKAEAVEQARTIERLNKIIKDAEDRVLRPLDTAKLVVTLSCNTLPEGLDLDLYVQDPDDQLCYWKQPRVLTADSETGMLIPSEDLRARANQAVEIFYSNRLLSRGPDHPYLIFAMLRTTAPTEAIEPVEVIWEVKARKGAELVIVGRGTKWLSQAGRVVVRDRLYVYSGLNPLCSFEVSSSVTANQTVQMRADAPNLLRGWQRSSIPEGSKDFHRIRDRSP